MLRRLGVLLAVLGLIGGCGNDANEGDLTQELAERLSDALAPDSGTKDYGAAPERHDSDNAYPQIVAIEAPATLAAGQSVTVAIQTDFSAPERIEAVMIHVNRAGYWIRVPATYDGGSQRVTLQSTFDWNASLAGQTFTVELALILDNGGAGNYHAWVVRVL